MKTYWQYVKSDLFGWPCLLMGVLWLLAWNYGRDRYDEAPIVLVVSILLLVASPISYLWRRSKIKQ
jgi:hypothetical protein